MEKALICGSKNPYDNIRIVDQSKCSKESLQACNIPRGSFTEIKNFSSVLLEEELVYVKEVNSYFCSIIIENNKYFIHQKFIQKIDNLITNEL